MHARRTRAIELAALHLVVRIGPVLQARLFNRPYIAFMILIFFLPLHAKVAFLPSQIVTDFVFFALSGAKDKDSKDVIIFFQNWAAFMHQSIPAVPIPPPPPRADPGN